MHARPIAVVTPFIGIQPEGRGAISPAVWSARVYMRDTGVEVIVILPPEHRQAGVSKTDAMVRASQWAHDRGYAVQFNNKEAQHGCDLRRH